MKVFLPHRKVERDMKNFEVYVVLLLLVIIAIMLLSLVYARKAYKELMAKADDLNGKSNSIMGLAGNFLKSLRDPKPSVLKRFQ